MKLFYYIRRFWEIPLKEKKLLISAIFLSGKYRFIILFLPIKFYLRLLTDGPKISSNYTYNTVCNIRKVNNTINRISKVVPWECNCLVKALMGKKLLVSLYGIPSLFVLQVAKLSNGEIKAHAILRTYNFNFTFISPGYVELILIKS